MAEARPVALVTGASRGIGAATAICLAGHGWDVAINYRSVRDQAEQVAGAVSTAGGRAGCYQADVSSAAQVATMFEQVATELGTVTELVTNAGLNKRNGVLEQSLEDWSEIISVDLTSPFLCAKAAVPGMLRAGGGSIEAVSSIAGITGGSVGLATSP